MASAVTGGMSGTTDGTRARARGTGIGMGGGMAIGGAAGVGRGGSKVMKATSVYCLSCRAGSRRKYRPSACIARMRATAAPLKLKPPRMRMERDCRWRCNGMRFPVGAGRDGLF